MTLSPLPAEPSDLMFLMTDAGLAEHAATAIRLLAARGVALPPVLVDQVEEVLTECLAREAGGLDRLADVEARLEARAPAAFLLSTHSANSNRRMEIVQ